jgi:Trp operon repressor
MNPKLTIDHSVPARAGYHAKLADGAGWENGELVAATPAPVDGEDAGRTNADAQTIIAGFLRLMTTDAPALLVGQRLHVLAYLTGQSHCSTQRELATSLNVSPARVSQILRTIPQEFASLCRLKTKSAERRRHR